MFFAKHHDEANRDDKDSFFPSFHLFDKIKKKSCFACQINGYPHIQYTTATVWNTSLVSYALQEAGVPSTDPVIAKVNRYLLSRQHYRYGDWAIHNPYSLPGGWGFSNINTMNPDVDDTTSSLRAIHKWVVKEPLFRQAWDRGIRWLFSMQNDDGGYGAQIYPSIRRKRRLDDFLSNRASNGRRILYSLPQLPACISFTNIKSLSEKI